MHLILVLRLLHTTHPHQTPDLPQIPIQQILALLRILIQQILVSPQILIQQTLATLQQQDTLLKATHRAVTNCDEFLYDMNY